MKSARRPGGILRGYLVKAAQTLSKFQKKKFYRRFYELNVERKELKIFEKDGGALKDAMKCDAAHVVTCLQKQLHPQYQDFFGKDSYHGTTIELPSEYKRPFAICFESGSLQVLFAGNQHDYQEWTQAFASICCSAEQAYNSRAFEYSQMEQKVPLPELTDQNYFVAALYYALLPAEITQTNINGIKSDRTRMTPTPTISSSKAPANDVEIVVTAQTVKGYLVKTVQGGMLKKKKLQTRYYRLNAQASTLYVGENPDDKDGTTIEFRSNRLAHVETTLMREIWELSEFKSVNFIPGGRSEPIGLIFTNGNLMLLWAKPGKEFKYWTRAFKRFIKPDPLLDEENLQSLYKTVFLNQKPENSFLLSVFQRLIPRISLEYSSILSQNENKAIEGWLCKTTSSLPKDPDEKPFLKAYCVFDFVKKYIFLCDKTNGQVVEKLAIDENLRYVDTSLTGKITCPVKHPLADKRLLWNLQLPLAFVYPFALVLADGSLHIFWAQSEAEANRWKTTLSALLPEPNSYNPDFANYVLCTKNNVFLTSLYMALGRKIDVEEDVEVLAIESTEVAEQPNEEEKVGAGRIKDIDDEVKRADIGTENIVGNFFECAEQIEGQSQFTQRIFKLQVADKRLSVFHLDSDATQETQLAYEIDLVAGRSISYVNNDLRLQFTTAEAKLVETGDDSLLNIELPNFSVAPFAVFFSDGEFLLLWATDDYIKGQFVEAFRSMAKNGEMCYWSEICGRNAFKINLYRCLLPDRTVNLSTFKLIDHIGNEARVAIPRPQANEAEKFPMCGIRLRKNKGTLEICNNSHNRVYKLFGRLSSIDTYLKNQLIACYKDNIRGEYLGADGELELPDGFPLALTFIDGDMILIWLPTCEAIERWQKALEGFLPAEKTQSQFLVIGQHNEFVATLYRSLKHTHNGFMDIDQIFSTTQTQPNREETTEIITGWLSRTQGTIPAVGQEPFLYRYYKLNLLTGVLTEHEDQEKSRTLNQFMLHRKIAFIETELSNELQSDYESNFQLHCNKSAPQGFTLPTSNVKPICLHLVDGDLLLLWASAKREYAKWLEALEALQLPVISQQRLLLRITQQNSFSASVFSSIKPAKQGQNEPEKLKVTAAISGRCRKTAQCQSTLQADYAFDRFYSLNFSEKKLFIMKQEKGGQKAKTHDLSNLRWIDASLTQSFHEGFKSIFKRDDIMLYAPDGVFTQVRGFKFPLVLGMQACREGNISILWFETVTERSQLHEALIEIVKSNSQQGCLTHDYIVQTKKNNFVASLYQVLKPEDGLENTKIVTGILSLAQNKNAPVFVDKFVTLNTETAVLSIFSQAFQEVEEEHDLRFAVAINDLNQERKDLQISPTLDFSLTLSDRVFAVHNGSQCFVFCAKESEQFTMWSAAFSKVERPEFRDPELWINGATNDTLAQSICHELSLRRPNANRAVGTEGENKVPSGFLCKTAQSLDKALSRKQNFYKRHYMIDEENCELLVRNTIDSAVKERLHLDKLIKVDAKLRSCLIPGYRQYFRQHTSANISTPKDFMHPFCLLFEGGFVQLLWAKNEQDLKSWTQSLKKYEPEQVRQCQLLLRHPENFFASTMYLCLKPETPAILLQQKFETRDDSEAVDANLVLQNLDNEEEEYKHDLTAEAMISAQGAIEGWLYKTSQTVGIFQQELFHKRYYRLDVRQGTLKVLTKQGGKVKSTLDLTKQIMRVDGDLKRSLTNEDTLTLGKSVFTPEFTFPFAVFTKKHSLVLWTETADKRFAWVNSFKMIMLGCSETDIALFQLDKDKKNKFVNQIYECLREPTYAIEDRQSDRCPSSAAEPTMPELSQGNIALQQMLPDEKKERADLELHLTEMAKDENDEQKQSNKTRKFSASKIKTVVVQKENQRTQSVSSVDIAKICKVTVNETGGGPAGVPNIVASIKEMRTSAQKLKPPTAQQTDAQPQQANLFTPVRRRPTAQLNSSTRMDNSRDIATNQSMTTDMKPGRKIRLPSANSGRAPIKIKKMIPLKDMTQMDTNRQSLKSVFTGHGQKQKNSLSMCEVPASFRLNQLCKTSNKVDDESDNDIERDPACEIIKAPFRRNNQSVTTAKKIKVKLWGQSQSTRRLPTNEQFVSEQRDEQQKQSNLILRLNFNTPSLQQPQPIVKENFEDRVKTQVDKDFVKNLLSRSGTSKTGISAAKSAWGEVAQNLRDKIKVKASKNTEQLLHQSSSSSFMMNSQLSNFDGHRGSISHRRSPALPIKVNGPIKILAQQQPEGSELDVNTDLRNNMPYSRSAAVTRNNHTMTQQEPYGDSEQKLSDWDDSDEESAVDQVNMGRQARKNSIVNVRDRTSGLSNVFNSQLLTQSNFDYSLSKKKSVAVNGSQRLFRSSYRRSAEAESEVNQLQVDLNPADIAEELPETDIEPLPATADDCIAESYNSVWD